MSIQNNVEVAVLLITLHLSSCFSIVAISTREAVWFPAWKVPCVLYWTRRTLPAELIQRTPLSPINAGVFLHGTVTQQPKRMSTFMPLNANEFPGKGECVRVLNFFIEIGSWHNILNNVRPETEMTFERNMCPVETEHSNVYRLTLDARYFVLMLYNICE